MYRREAHASGKDERADALADSVAGLPMRRSMTGGHRRELVGRGRAGRFVVLIVLVFVCGFAYGWPTGRRGIFPYPQFVAARALFTRARVLDSDAPDTPPGRFRISRPAPAGVTMYDREACYPGLNLLVSGHGPAALLVDMDGRVLHRWTCDFASVWPDAAAAWKNRDAQFWRTAHVFPNGDLLAIYDGLGMIKLDRESNLVWSYPGPCYHDLFVTEEGFIYALEQEAAIVPRLYERRPVLVNFISVLNPQGELLRRVPILEAFENSPYAPLLQRTFPAGDIFHTNTIEVLDGRLAHVSSAFRAGNVLVCVRNIETVAIVDMEFEKVVWAMTGRFSRQNQLTVLDNGHLLVFNNEDEGPGATERCSSVVEFDPFTQETLWSYRGSAETSLYSETCGSCQRLPNGNTLVTESDNGRALEVSRDGTIVWEFVSPYRAGGEGELIATLLEAVRLPLSFGSDWVREKR